MSGQQQFLVFFDGNTTTDISLDVVQVGIDVDLLNRLASFDILAIGTQLILLEGCLRFVRLVEHFLTGLNSSQTPPSQFASPLQQSTDLLNCEHITHLLPLLQLSLQHFQKHQHKLSFGAWTNPQRLLRLIRKDIFVDPHINSPSSQKDHFGIGTEVSIDLSQGFETFEDIQKNLVCITCYLPRVKSLENIKTKSGRLQENPSVTRVHHFNDRHFSSSDMVSSCIRFCQSLLRFKDRLSQGVLPEHLKYIAGLSEIGQVL